MSANVKDVNCDVAAKHAARCVALANILRAQAVMKTREIVIPLEFIAAHKVDMRRLVEKKNDEKIEEMIFDIATVAHANLTKIQSMRSVHYSATCSQKTGLRTVFFISELKFSTGFFEQAFFRVII